MRARIIETPPAAVSVPQPVLLTAWRKARRAGWATSVFRSETSRGTRYTYRLHRVDDLDHPGHCATVYKDGSLELNHRETDGSFSCLEEASCL